MEFIPHIISRSAGDIVDHEQLNNQNRKLYSDLSNVFIQELALHARNKINATMLEAISSATYRHIDKNITLSMPTINTDTIFIYPTVGAKASISTFYKEITANISGDISSVIDGVGLIRQGVDVTRSSDNLVFSNTPKSLSETRVLDAIETSELPYILRIKGVNEKISLRLDIKASFGNIEMNAFEYSPFPMIGGSELRDVDLLEQDGGLVAITDPIDKVIDFVGVPDDWYKPVRIFTKPRTITQLSVNLRSDLYVPSINGIVVGVYQIRPTKLIFEPQSYIGFRIPYQKDKTLKSITPIYSKYNSYKGIVTTKVYKTITGLLNKDENNLATMFTSDGKGVPVTTNKDLFALVSIETEENISPQIKGFEYKIG